LSNDLKNIGDKEFKSSVTYNTELSFQDLDEYTALFAKSKAPSKRKGAVVMNVIASIPNTNTNGMGFTAEVLRNSYQSMLDCPLDYEHEQHIILGHVKDSKIVDEDGLATLRTAAITYKKRLADWNVENLTDMRYSMECIPDDYAFWIKSKGIIEKGNAPSEWKENLNDWDINPIYDTETNERVILLLGGSSGTVEFIGIGITDHPADKTANTLLQVANDKNKEGQTEMTEQEMQAKIEAVAKEKDDIIAKLNGDITNMTATASEKDVKIQEFEAKASEFETQVGEITQKLEASNSKLKEFVVASRKQVLASKNVPADLIEKKAEFIASATDEQFGEYVAEVEVFASAFGKEVTASDKNKDLNVIPNLTGDKDKNKETSFDLSYM
jgi:hypothetical protein